MMAAALELAARGRGAVEPNPMVGAIIARGGMRIGGGWHRRLGGPHAEIEAMEAARATGHDVTGATLYVTLEPCPHHGKTPPCTEAIVAGGIGRVVVAMTDPNQNVAGRGIAALRSAGLEVTVGVGRSEARALLAAYRKLCTARRPWVICKWAQTADGYLALPPHAGRWVSGEDARAQAHELRGVCDAICVGVGTVLADDPLLTNRSGSGKRPLRIVLDSKLRTPPDCRLAQTAQDSPVVVATAEGSPAADPSRADALHRAGIELLELPRADLGVDLPALLDELGRRDCTYLLVEGGAAVLKAFIDADLCDELLVFVSPDDAPAPVANLPRLDIADLREALTLGEPQVRQFGDDRMLRYVLTE